MFSLVHRARSLFGTLEIQVSQSCLAVLPHALADRIVVPDVRRTASSGDPILSEGPRCGGLGRRLPGRLHRAVFHIGVDEAGGEPYIWLDGVDPPRPWGVLRANEQHRPIDSDLPWHAPAAGWAARTARLGLLAMAAGDGLRPPGSVAAEPSITPQSRFRLCPLVLADEAILITPGHPPG